MNDHYFSENPASKSSPAQFTCAILGQSYTFHTDAGVFSRDGLDPGTKLLLKTLPPLQGRVLDLGCGWGALGIPLARENPAARFLLADVNARAVALAEQNCRENRVANVQTLQSDGFAKIEGTFDQIVSNPPIRAGKQVVYALFAESERRLNPGGALTVVVRKQQGAPSAIQYLQTLFAEVAVPERGGGYWIIRAQKANP